MNLIPSLKTLTVPLLAGFFAVNAVAEWQWIDTDGKKVFSDRSPPPGTPDKNIVKRPGAAATVVAPPSASSAAPTPAVAAAQTEAPKVSGRDAQLEEKKKQASDDAAAKKKADEEKIAKTKAENCESARRYLTTLDSGMRIASVNAKGEREMLDDSQRAEAKKRTQGVAQSNCK